MDEIIELTKIDFSYVFIAVFVILIGIKVIISLFEWAVDKLGQIGRASCRERV